MFVIMYSVMLLVFVINKGCLGLNNEKWVFRVIKVYNRYIIILLVININVGVYNVLFIGI